MNDNLICQHCLQTSMEYVCKDLMIGKMVKENNKNKEEINRVHSEMGGYLLQTYLNKTIFNA